MVKQEYVRNDRNYALDVIRIVAATLLVFFHYQQYTGACFKYFNLFYQSKFYVGRLVELFFCVSGYFTYRHGRCGGGNNRAFLAKRVMRLLPMTAIATFFLQLNLCLYYLLSDDMPLGPLEHVGDAVSLWRFIVAALGIDAGWVVKTADVGFTTWYISVLMLCYVVFCLITFISGKLKVTPTYMYVFMVLVGIAINTYNMDFPFLNAWSARGYCAFFAGLLLATYHEKEVSIWGKIGSVIVVVGIIGSYFFDFSRRIIKRDDLEEAYILTFVLYPAIITIMNFSCMKKIFRFKFLGVLGQCSFDVYIWHVPILILVYNIVEWWNLSIQLSSAQCMVCFSLIVWIIGIASYYLIENKIHNVLLKKFELSSQAK